MFSFNDLTWAKESDSPGTLKRKFAALEDLERQLGLAALWQHARVPNRNDEYEDGDEDEDEIYFKKKEKSGGGGKVAENSFVDEEDEVEVRKENRSEYFYGGREADKELVYSSTIHSSTGLSSHLRRNSDCSHGNYIGHGTYTGHNYSFDNQTPPPSRHQRRIDDFFPSSITKPTKEEFLDETFDEPEVYQLPSSQSEPESSGDESFSPDSPPSKKRKPVKRPAPALKRNKFKKATVSVDEPTFTRIPTKPIPVTWCAHIHNPLRVSDGAIGCIEVESDDLLSGNWITKVTSKQPILAAYIDPPVGMSITNLVSRLATLLLRLFTAKRGYLFIWTPRAQMATLMKEADRKLGFKYVENLCWIKKGLNSRILATNEGGILADSKQTLLILKGDPSNTIKLRHQRNPDCIFDYCVQGRKPDARVYDVIETLIKPTREDSIEPYLVHLWAGSSPTDRLVLQSRNLWIRVIEQQESVNEPIISSDFV